MARHLTSVLLIAQAAGGLGLQWQLGSRAVPAARQLSIARHAAGELLDRSLHGSDQLQSRLRDLVMSLNEKEEAVLEDAEEEDDIAKLKQELYDILDEVPDRGLGADEADMQDILDVAEDLKELVDLTDFEFSPILAGNWRLVYTSSKAFHTNQGLIGYARDVKGIVTPELYMKIEKRYKKLAYEEPITYGEGSLASFFGKVAQAESVRAECTWRTTGDGLMLVVPTQIVAGSRSWEPMDRQAKAMRTLGACRPIFLDEELFILQSQIASVIFIFERS